MSEWDAPEPERAGRHFDGIAATTPSGPTRPLSLQAFSDTSSAVMTSSGAGAAPQSAPAQVTFDRMELRAIFDLYGRKVASGEWRDYAIDFLRDRAVFSVFRRSTEFPLYRIEKTPRLARKQGAYAVVTASGLILKRGPELARVLKVLDKPRLVVS
jgi:hypothetical protein